MQWKFNTRYTLWNDRAEFDALNIDYYRLGKYAVEYMDLDETLWGRRAVKQLIHFEGALDEYEKSFNSKNENLFIGNDETNVLRITNSNEQDTFFLGDGINILIAERGNQNSVFATVGGEFFNFIEGSDQNDIIIGGDAMDFTATGTGNDIFMAGKGNDHTYTGRGNDTAYLGEGNDWADGWSGDDIFYGGGGNDWLLGRMDNDILYAGRGEDILEGGEGNDVLVFDSDAGVPTTLIGDFSLIENTTGNWNDTAIGGEGSDTFIFQYEMDATKEVLERNLMENGRINWMSIMRENENPHDHWVNWNGFDIIKDFEKGKDIIRLEGHTVDYELHYLDQNENGVDDTTLIEVYSNQALMVAGVMGVDVKDLPADIKMAHDRDSLGFIQVNGVILSKKDIIIDTSITHAVDEFYFDRERDLSTYLEIFDDLIGV